MLKISSYRFVLRCMIWNFSLLVSFLYYDRKRVFSWGVTERLICLCSVQFRENGSTSSSLGFRIDALRVSVIFILLYCYAEKSVSFWMNSCWMFLFSNCVHPTLSAVTLASLKIAIVVRCRSIKNLDRKTSKSLTGHVDDGTFCLMTR